MDTEPSGELQITSTGMTEEKKKAWKKELTTGKS
jgi:hypothetical protein